MHCISAVDLTSCHVDSVSIGSTFLSVSETTNYNCTSVVHRHDGLVTLPCVFLHRAKIEKEYGEKLMNLAKTAAGKDEIG